MTLHKFTNTPSRNIRLSEAERVIRKQIKQPTLLSFSFATAVVCFDSDPGINEFME